MTPETTRSAITELRTRRDEWLRVVAFHEESGWSGDRQYARGRVAAYREALQLLAGGDWSADDDTRTDAALETTL